MVERDDLETILARVLEETKRADGTVNLKEIERRTGVSYKRLRKWKDDGYRLLPDRRGRAAGSVKLLGYTDTIDGLLRNGVENSVVITDLIRKDGYAGGLSIVKDYIREHRNLVPLPRVVAVPRPEHVRRWYTEAGDCYQMDWGFVMVEDGEGRLWKCACFVMVCHHCGFRYIEFFPNSMQESLFIGMLHAFSVMGVPRRVLTDNMKSVTLGRDANGNVVWNAGYDAFQRLVGFETTLCKVAHPYTKGAVERLVRYVKGNFIPGRRFYNCNELNRQALAWCAERNSQPTRTRALVPAEAHMQEWTRILREDERPFLMPYLAPRRKLSLDRFVQYEGRRYGVPSFYTKRSAWVMRDHERLLVLDCDDCYELAAYDVDWAKRDKTCPGQWDYGVSGQPEEQPTSPVKSILTKVQDDAMDAEVVDMDRFSLFAAIGRSEVDNG